MRAGAGQSRARGSPYSLASHRPRSAPSESCLPQSTTLAHPRLLVVCRRILLFPAGNNVQQLSVYLDVADSATLPQGWSRQAHFALTVQNTKDPSKSVVKGAGLPPLPCPTAPPSPAPPCQPHPLPVPPPASPRLVVAPATARAPSCEQCRAAASAALLPSLCSCPFATLGARLLPAVLAALASPCLCVARFASAVHHFNIDHQSPDWGFRKFLPIKDLRDPLAGFVQKKGDKLVITARVRMGIMQSH